MSKRWAVLLTHTAQDFEVNYETDAVRALEELAEVRGNPFGRHLSSADLQDCGQGCQVIISGPRAIIDAAVIRSLKDLVAVIRCGVELRSIDVDAASAAGVLVLNV